MADVDPELRRAKSVAERELLNRPGVTGVDIGYKEVGGSPTNLMAIRVLVNHKRDVPPPERIPETIEGFPTDVIERRFELHPLAVDAGALLQAATDPKEYSALTGGISIGPCRLVHGRAWGGTLGALVTDNATGRPMILSNFHVMAVDHSWSAGDAIVQPSRIDAGACPRSEVAVLQRAVVGGQVDCAVAEISARQTGCEIVDIGDVSGTSAAVIGQLVQKRGRTTGVTYGVVDTVDLTVVDLDYPGIGTIELTNQIGVKPTPSLSAKFGDQGDSGAVVVNDNREVVGLYFGGGSDGYGLANPIAAVVDALNVTLCTPPEQTSPSPEPSPSFPPVPHPYPPPYPPTPPALRPYPLPAPYPWEPPWLPLPPSSDPDSG
jgi:hypothetical protein